MEFNVPIVLFSLLFTVKFGKCSSFELFGQNIGCFKRLPNVSESSQVISTPAASYNVENCLNACLDVDGYRYGGLEFSQACTCFSSIETQDRGVCNKTCPGNSTQICGGDGFVSIYATGHYVPGPPKTLNLSNTSESRIEIKWSKPVAVNEMIEDYVVSAILIETHASVSLGPNLEWNYPNSTMKADLLNLHPGTRYNISVRANSKLGMGAAKYLAVWTHIGEPTPPEDVEIISRQKNTMKVKVNPINNENGPITAYRLIVISDVNAIVEEHNLRSWSDASRDDIPYYIAAEVDPQIIEKEFTVGDGRWYGVYFNTPLSAEKTYRITVGIKSTFEGITRYGYAKQKPMMNVIILDNKANDDDSSLAHWLVVAIVFSALLLCGCIVVYFVIRRRIGYRRRRANYRQELTLQGPIIEVVNDGYVPEEIDERVNYYEKLQQQVWNIPRSSLELKDEHVGQGRFGSLFKGVIQHRGIPMPTLIYSIEDGKLCDVDKRTMLKELGTLIECGKHNNVLALVGTSEAPETLFIVLEYHPSSLKEMLVEGRILSQPEKDKIKFCSILENDIISFAIGISRGMEFLSSKKIIHKQLTARNIAMADGVVPKITGFGISSYHKQNQIADYTRWTAQEVFKKCSYSTKSDAWSFGCLLWEICVVGGTPYANVENHHVSARVIHGLRLPQTEYIGDCLYQLMLDCWQIDLDERPSFRDITSTLEGIVDRNEVPIELNFILYPGFQYMPYFDDLELQS
ncbi:putative tyrosine-protein kinase Wsck [Nilaparvata lugens]|uniref:putative tyrosine-protein kinase Wsck n=1 Tax=Nilaparvata lugens TaxID=108931 RepID=UPI00193CEA7B|nr:putative tyrosine-protein kinase Wsck [Nilaparvata lugens]